MKINRQVVKYLYYFFNFIIVFLIIFIIHWFGSQHICLQENVKQEPDQFFEVTKDQELSPDFILSQIQEEESLVSMVAVGDIMLSRVVGQKMLAHGYDYPFKKMADITKDADLSFANLETAVLPGRVVQTGEMMFRSDPESLASMVKAGFDIVSLANNHTPNYGQNGLKKTFEYLKKHGIDYVGAGKDFSEAHKPLIKEINGISMAFLAYNDSDVVPDSYGADNNWAGTAIMNVDQLKKDIQGVRDQVDLIIISMHSGTEYIYTANKRQSEFAHAAIDSGADLVIGHHPHVVQEMEVHKGKYIFYSLGNFIFDQMWSEETRQGLVLKLLLNKEGVEEFMFVPVVIEDYAQPRSADLEESGLILSRLSHDLHDKKILIYDGKEYKIETRQGLFSDEKGVNNYFKLDFSGKEAVIYHDEAHERVYALVDQEIIWTSDPEWQVEKVAVGDVNYDDQEDLTMIVWKKGNYGPDKPFWVEENDMSLGNHLFVYTFENSEFKPLWQSSGINKPNIDLWVVDIDNNGRNELVVLEDDDSDLGQAEYVAVWQWDDWGFSNVWRSEAGVYEQLDEVMGGVGVE